MKRIPLSATLPRGRSPRGFALVDDEDFDALMAVGAWALQTRNEGPGVYAFRRSPYVMMHRLIMGLEVGDPRCVDHIDHDGLNNQRTNLRVCRHAENAQNVLSRPHTSRFRGVIHVPNCSINPWLAYVYRARKQIWCRHFPTEIEAAIAVDAARRELMPFALPDPAFVEMFGDAA